MERKVEFNSKLRGDIIIRSDGHEWTSTSDGFRHTYSFNCISGKISHVMTMDV